MNESRDFSGTVEIVEALSSKDVLALLLPRIRIALPQIKDKRKLKQTEELLSALEELEKVLFFQDERKNNSIEQTENPYHVGMPRCTFQIEEQFGHYVNPESTWRGKWKELRIAAWEVFEKTIPWTVREMLMSWRWKAELTAFKKMQTELEKSRELVKDIEQELQLEERKGQKQGKSVSIIDRFRILVWSRAARRDEDVLLAFEQERDETQRLIFERLSECERLSALTAVGLRTLFVDCGELYPRIFEDCTRAMDKTLRMQSDSAIRALEAQIALLRAELEDKSKAIAEETRKTTDRKEKVLQLVEEKASLSLADAEQLLFNEFMLVNTFELEKQDEARSRWQRAVTQMKRVLQSAEENFGNVEIYARDFDGDGSRRAATPQIRI
jgi:hypothetical protein